MGMYVALFLVGGLSFHVESCDPTGAWPVAGADGFVSESIREALSFYTMTLPQYGLAPVGKTVTVFSAGVP